MTAGIFLFVSLVLLFVSPLLILIGSGRWLKLAVLVGVLGSFALLRYAESDFEVNDPGPAGMFVMAYLGLVASTNVLALMVRFIASR